MRVLIVDDETRAREKLRRMLEAHDDVVVVGEAANGPKALELVAKLQPAVVFLDVKMPARDGFAVVASLPEPAPSVVFVTAYEEHALRAFDADAAGYLLKPVSIARLERTLRRLRATGLSPPAPADAADGPRLLISDKGRTTVVDCADIAWLASEGNYVRVHANGRSFLTRRTLADLLDEIGPNFTRIHRCTAVSLSRVRAVCSRAKGDATVVLQGGRELPCSRQHRSALLERLRKR